MSRFLRVAACIIFLCISQSFLAAAGQTGENQEISDDSQSKSVLDVEEALSELDLSELEEFVSDNLSKTHMGFGELVQKLLCADESVSLSQVTEDVNFEHGMGVSVGRLREDTVYDWKFVGLSHNTVRGAAGGAVLTAELLTAKNYITAK